MNSLGCVQSARERVHAWPSPIAPRRIRVSRAHRVRVLTIPKPELSPYVPPGHIHKKRPCLELAALVTLVPLVSVVGVARLNVVLGDFITVHINTCDTDFVSRERHS